MDRRQFLIGAGAIGVSLISTSCASARPDEETNTLYNLIDEGEVRLQEFARGSGLTYFAPHDDERTSLSAARRVVRARGGRVMWLAHSGRRNIRFTYQGKRYEFDPNRMFSDRGAEATLKAQGSGNYSVDARKIVRNFAKDVVEQLRRPSLRHGLIVGLHNNTNNRYSARSYMQGGELAGEAADVFLAEGRDPDDFFFVTSRSHFDFFKSQVWSAVLQARRPTDDGSLSVYWARQGKPYINVEAQHGHESAQREMLALVASLA